MTFTPSYPLEVDIGESPNDQYIHNVTATDCVFLLCMRTTPLSDQHEVLFPSKFGTLVLLLQGGGGCKKVVLFTVCITVQV